jgi:hypothetical protein
LSESQIPIPESQIPAAIAVAVLFAFIYAPALGHGFVKDDFRWIAAADVHSAGDVARLFASNVGFYRPLVTTTFAIDRRIWNLDPRGYAVTNLILLLADAGLLFLLARRLLLPGAAALFAVAVWLFNFHGINMALIWISGRTALLLCLFSLAAALAWLRGNRAAAALLALAAMLCKEEAIMLPPLLLLIDVVRGDGHTVNARRALFQSWPLWAAAAIYLILRSHSGAFGVADAPSYYRLTFDPRVVLKNAAQYLDRGATWALVAAAVMYLLVPRDAMLNDGERRGVRFGVAWFALLFAVTIFVPVRSSLYAVAPSIGSALVAAVFAARARTAVPHRFAIASTVLIAAILLLIPVYRTRNRGLVEPADLSAQSLAMMRRAAEDRPPVREIVLLDDRHASVKLDDAFGALAPDAVHLFVSPETDVSVTDSALPSDQRRDDVMVFELRGGRLVQERARTNGSPADTSPSHSG